MRRSISFDSGENAMALYKLNMADPDVPPPTEDDPDVPPPTT